MNQRIATFIFFVVLIVELTILVECQQKLGNGQRSFGFYFSNKPYQGSGYYRPQYGYGYYGSGQGSNNQNGYNKPQYGYYGSGQGSNQWGYYPWGYGSGGGSNSGSNYGSGDWGSNNWGGNNWPNNWGNNGQNNGNNNGQNNGYNYPNNNNNWGSSNYPNRPYFGNFLESFGFIKKGQQSLQKQE